METNGKLMKPELVVAGALRAFERVSPYTFQALVTR